ncbi:porphobilinogen synthase [Enterococcus sp. PF1-24]|uniref:porphobilinogen synthase n=1 Tax=unclassified Enterococcus TaxID=2608891 RepID=UPI002476DE84|nr:MULTISPECIES: porphobilinogen synthase [unclassified Enterococcus]MDH6363370.1 porphobilinogen synthase [Enterococcus sp. PFB1-1]MDH6400329.1 porphobilinogen synthase [Enterococcus sp. PF1-24]
MEKFKRHRNLRKSTFLREMLRENQVGVKDLIYPIFVKEVGETQEISAMPGIYQFNLKDYQQELLEISALGIKSIMLFGLPEKKDEVGSGAYDDNGIVQQAIRIAKAQFPELVVIADTCLCEYTSHGHCGVIHNQEVDNDASLELLVKTAISQAKSGADIIAPSNAMDGFVIAIREGLDAAGFKDIPIMSYAIKYASSFYGPFREAAQSAPQFGNRKTYQMDPANQREAMRELASDITEGADLVMVKPALSFLDIVADVRAACDLPVVCYNVSGEYSMVKAAAANGWIDEVAIVEEMLTSMKRAGADLIITYFAKEYAQRNQR